MIWTQWHLLEQAKGFEFCMGNVHENRQERWGNYLGVLVLGLLVRAAGLSATLNTATSSFSPSSSVRDVATSLADLLRVWSMVDGPSAIFLFLEVIGTDLEWKIDWKLMRKRRGVSRMQCPSWPIDTDGTLLNFHIFGIWDHMAFEDECGFLQVSLSLCFLLLPLRLGILTLSFLSIPLLIYEALLSYCAGIYLEVSGSELSSSFRSSGSTLSILLYILFPPPSPFFWFSGVWCMHWFSKKWSYLSYT